MEYIAVRSLMVYRDLGHIITMHIGSMILSFNTRLHSQKTGPPVDETGTVAVDRGGGGGCDVVGSSGMDIMLYY